MIGGIFLKTHNISFVNLSELFEGFDESYSEYCEYCPFSFGDASYTLIDLRSFRIGIQPDDWEDLPQTVRDRIESLPKGSYINLEN